MTKPGDQESISSVNEYGEIVENPESKEDSIYAVIDAGHVTFLMEEDGDKATYIWKNPELRPKSKAQFVQKRSDLLSQLRNNNKQEEVQYE